MKGTDDENCSLRNGPGGPGGRRCRLGVAGCCPRLDDHAAVLRRLRRRLPVWRHRGHARLAVRHDITASCAGRGCHVKGKLTDRPLPPDPSIVCFDDGYYSRATFVAYAGSVEVDRQTRAANNAVVTFEFTLGGSSTSTGINRVKIQVCRSPINTLPPSYCGKAVTYLAPPTA